MSAGDGSGDHVGVRVDRRSFCLSIAASLGTAGACTHARTEEPRTGLIRLLGLTGADRVLPDTHDIPFAEDGSLSLAPGAYQVRFNETVFTPVMVFLRRV